MGNSSTAIHNPQPRDKHIVQVAVAVIYYQDQYLLGYRDSSQHQGDRYEFVGGKIEPHETASQALIREVGEETGIDIQDNIIVKLGRLHHDYGDKQVSLQVYHIELTAQQYAQHQHQDVGLEGQMLAWVDKSALLDGKYPLPAANQTILAWLMLPTQMSITYPLAHFSARSGQDNNQEDDPVTAAAAAAWLNHHQTALKQDAWVYVRLKGAKAGLSDPDHQAQLIVKLIAIRPDIHVVLPHADAAPIDKCVASVQIKACCLTHRDLMQWACDPTRSSFSSSPQAESSPSQADADVLRPLIISCHDTDSILAANRLAATRLSHQQAPVIGIFLSPVLPTQTHPDTPALGWEAWAKMAALADVPVIALGGLSPTMATQAASHGALSIAGIRRFMAG